MDIIFHMALVRSILALLLFGLLAQSALACSERVTATPQPQAVTTASDVARLEANGSIGEERPACECPCPASASAPAVSESDRASHSTGASDCARPWSVLQPLTAAGRDGPGRSPASPPAPRYLLVARLLQ